MEEVQEERPAHQQAGRHREGKNKGEGAARPLNASITTAGWRNATVTLSKAHDNHKGGSVRAAAKVSVTLLCLSLDPLLCDYTCNPTVHWWPEGEARER